MLLTEKMDQGQYQGTVGVQSAGLVHWATHLTADASGHGKIAAGGLVPEDFLQHYITSQSDRLIEIGFQGTPPTGALVREVNKPVPGAKPPDNSPSSPLPADQRLGALDPLSAILAMGQGALTSGKSFTVPVFDGKVRYDLAITPSGPARHNMMGRNFNTIDISVAVHPVGGFKPYQFHVWSSAHIDIALDPQSGLPLRISTDSFFAPILLSAKAVCPPDPACSLAPAE